MTQGINLERELDRVLADLRKERSDHALTKEKLESTIQRTRVFLSDGTSVSLAPAEMRLIAGLMEYEDEDSPTKPANKQVTREPRLSAALRACGHAARNG